MTNAERQAKWRDKNRALFNLRRRNARRKDLPVPALAEPTQRAVTLPRQETPAESGEVRESAPSSTNDDKLAPLATNAASPNADSDSRGGQNPTIEALRELVMAEEEKPATEARKSPDAGIYRNDSGGVISKFAWEKLQKLKEKAKKGGYTLDEYSQ